MTIAVSLYSFEFGFVTLFTKHELYKACSFESGNFKDQSVPIISYVYTRSIASKMFNYKHVLRDLNIDDFKYKTPDCTCASFPFIYNPTGHVITGDLKIINNS
jgi:hypothetical protein